MTTGTALRWILRATLCLAAVTFLQHGAQSQLMAGSTLAYIGPGPGLGMIGSLLAVLAVVVIGLLGLVLYPLRLFRQWRRSKVQTGTGGADSGD